MGRLDRADDDWEPDGAWARGADGAEAPEVRRAADGAGSAEAARGAEVSRAADGRERREPADGDVRVALAVDYRAKVAAAERDYAIDQGYARVSEVERGTVTPAMRRIEAEDPDRHLVGLEHRLKGKDRLAEKVAEAMVERSRTVDQAFASVKDAIRYTLSYPEDRYAEGVHADCERLKDSGFQPVERRNSWEHEEYKGINSRWRVPDNGQLFEVQFHTQASFKAKQETHWAYEKLRDPATSKAEQEAAHAYQREVTARIPIPPGVQYIPDYSER